MTKRKVNIGTLSAYQLVEMLDNEHPHRCIGQTEDHLSAVRRGAVRDLIDSLMKRIQREENGTRPTQISV
jgi:hypothetical protein